MVEVAEKKVSLENLRKGDIITLATKEKVTVREAIHHPDGVGVVIELSENYPLLFEYNGDCPDVPEFKIVDVEFVELPEDKEVYYTPNHDIIIAPVVTIKGRNKIIAQRIVNSIFELNSFPLLPSGSKIEADTKYVAVFTLIKKQGRISNTLKKELVICESLEHAKSEIKKMKERYKDVSDGDNSPD